MDRRRNWAGREHSPVNYLLTVVCRDDHDTDVRELLIQTVPDEAAEGLPRP